MDAENKRLRDYIERLKAENQIMAREVARLRSGEPTEQEETTPKMTKGQYRVGVAFNPSGDSEVAKIKEMAAALIDRVEEFRLATLVANGLTNVDAEWEHEVMRLYALAQTDFENGAMWAVKALTKEVAGG